MTTKHLDAWDIVEDDDGEDGWSGGGPPLSWEEWPSAGDVPLRHLFTVRVPEPHRAGRSAVGVSVFVSMVDWENPRLPLSCPHPAGEVVEDVVGYRFVLVWLSEDELATDRAEPPPFPGRVEEALDTNLRLVPREPVSPETPRFVFEDEDDEEPVERAAESLGNFGGVSRRFVNAELGGVGPAYLAFQHALGGDPNGTTTIDVILDLERRKAYVEESHG